MPSVAAVTGQSSSRTSSPPASTPWSPTAPGISAAVRRQGHRDRRRADPVGPSGKRASMYNGLADSIWVGSKNKPAAAKWVEFLGSPDCQNIVGEKGVVFPAIPAATDKAEAAFKAKGVDVTAFTVQVKDKTTFLFPITDHASQIDGIMHPAMDDVLSGKAQRHR